MMHLTTILHYTRKPQTVVYNELVRTTRPWMRNVTGVEEEWLQEFAPAANVRKARGTDRRQKLLLRRTTEVSNVGELLRLSELHNPQWTKK